MDKTEEELFPKILCAGVLGELSAWTSVQDILTAARILESRITPADQPDTQLIMPMEHGELFEAVFLRAAEWLTAGYAPPPAKVTLACFVDPLIRGDTARALSAARFNPVITSNLLASPERGGDETGKRVLIVKDEPIIIEMIQSPLRCLMDVLSASFELASKSHNLQNEFEVKTGGRPSIWHRPYSDSRLYATLDALCFYAVGLGIGPYQAPASRQDIDVSYRAVNVRGRPPFRPELVKAARDSMQRMLDDLR